jgi:hypothetical protein
LLSSIIEVATGGQTDDVRLASVNLYNLLLGGLRELHLLGTCTENDGFNIFVLEYEDDLVIIADLTGPKFTHDVDVALVIQDGRIGWSGVYIDATDTVELDE